MRISNVSAVQPGCVSASLSGDTLQLVKMGTFAGLSRVTYTSTSDTGATISGILFVRVRMPDWWMVRNGGFFVGLPMTGEPILQRLIYPHLPARPSRTKVRNHFR